MSTRTMKLLESLKQTFINPPSEFSPIPFWFWNDELSKSEIIRQIHDFRAKEVEGFVIHPRMGLPRTMPYLSESYMELVEAAVAEAQRLGMKVILYDEGMYPSGSACGMVVQHNPEYASRALQLREYACGEENETFKLTIDLSQGEKLVSAQAVCKLTEQEITMERTIVLKLEQGSDHIEFTPPNKGSWSVLLLVDTYSQGTIRGVHPGQDDGEPDAPLAADLLNPEATNTFIALTHERYYEKLQQYFGTTIFAMFTDEPDLLGRGHKEGLMPWTTGFMEEFLAGGGREEELPALWFEAGEEAERIRHYYKKLVQARLSRTYYKPLADWCEAHGIGLTGHPAASDDIGLLEHFHIPGQDIVWRYVAPEDDKAITGMHSTMGKCSSDAARHRSRRRNLNESFGVCGREGGWSLTADNMKWYLDWLFVRGVNLIVPHAFYYSIRGERRDERPPDVGPNNIWWSEYAQFARYMKRMSWLMTDSVNGAEVAVLAQASYLPWRIVKPLYERQIEFNYLEEELLLHASHIVDGTIHIAKQRYSIIVIEDGRRYSKACEEMLAEFVQQGGKVIEWKDEKEGLGVIGQQRAFDAEEAADLVATSLDRINAFKLQPAQPTIRISRITKEGTNLLVVVNEGETSYEGKLLVSFAGTPEIWYPWTGELEAAQYSCVGDKQAIKVSVARRECIVIAWDRLGSVTATVDKSDVEPSELSEQNDKVESFERETRTETIDLSEDWHIDLDACSKELSSLASWTEWAGLEHYSGSVIYTRSFELPDDVREGSIELDLGEVHEIARLSVNGQELGVRMWKPYVFQLKPELLQSHNELQVEVTNSLANSYDGLSLPSGIIGPVSLTITRSK